MAENSSRRQNIALNPPRLQRKSLNVAQNAESAQECSKCIAKKCIEKVHRATETGLVMTISFPGPFRQEEGLVAKGVTSGPGC